MLALNLRALIGTAILVASSGALAARESSIEQAIDRGKTMYAYDRAAWLTSDDLLSRLPQSRHGEVGGWIVTPAASGVHIDYFGKDAAADRVDYAADVIGESVTKPTVYSAEAAPLLRQPALQMARALRVAWSEMEHHPDWQPCAPARFNTVVLPPQRDGTVPVYFLTPQTETEQFPFGGHYEVDIAADGKTARALALTRGCLMVGKQPNESGGPIVAVFVTHLLNPHPTEIHVFEQYYVGVPVMVATGAKSIWKVQNGTIKDVSAQMAK